MFNTSLSGEYAITPDVTVNVGARMVYVDKKHVHLRTECFDALLLLMEYRLKDEYVPYEAFDKISSETKTSDVRMLSNETVRTIIKDIRKVIGKETIATRYQRGYWLVPLPTAFAITRKDSRADAPRSHSSTEVLKSAIIEGDTASIGDTVLGGWKLVRLLGSGSSGQVYEAHRIIDGITHLAAIKIISIPASPSHTTFALDATICLRELKDYYREAASLVIREEGILSGNQECDNIVSHAEHQVVEHSDGFGYTIIIRMEYLSSVPVYFGQHPPKARDIVILGMDICKALAFCEKRHILHRDIKPDNIYIDDEGNYKLGDFGTSCTVEQIRVGGSMVGTQHYMSPEAFGRKAIDSRADIYSLGLVMYKYLNQGRFPFVPANTTLSFSLLEESLSRRLSGEPIPPIEGISRELSNIITKACAYDAQDRFSSAKAFHTALASVF